MDLISGYLLIIVLLLTINISLFLGNFKLNNIELLGISTTISLLSFISIYLSRYFQSDLSFMLNYFFIILSLILFFIFLFYFKNRKYLVLSIVILIGVFVGSIFILSSQTSQFNFLYSLFVFILVFLIYQITKLLYHAKREYPVIIGEFTSLSTILIFIFGLTYFSTLNLNQEMFSSFLILTPTYQLIHVIILLVVILIVGVLYDDNRGKL
ncbi:hypothetical protein MBORA_08420 [Methanobrevibacter oralis]|uniref:Uncharacterized protein n=1 Tax=Methanobrevibacter oralis TaxID=66851 RepID=A0A166BCY3_METOA|nr:hypothetical protein MBORA_08420 [Methanobrevibacter oralis]